MAWSLDANRLFIFLKEMSEIREIIDVQLEKCKTAYERREVEFRMVRTYKVNTEE